MIRKILLTPIRKLKISISLGKKYNSEDKGEKNKPRNDKRNNQSKPQSKEQISMTQAQSILDEINKARKIGTDMMTKTGPDQSMGQSASIEQLKLLTGGLDEQDTVSYFNADEVNALREQIQPQCPQVEQFLKNRYNKFAAECYDDGYNKRYKNIFDGTSVQLPTTNEEGERHRELDVDWKKLVFLEDHIKDMPQDGPLGLFFESAAHGLSQNPFISLDEKREQLEWFRQYFQLYEEDLLNLDAVQPGQLDTAPILLPEIDEKGNKIWPSQKVVTDRYDEMNPWTTNWVDLDKGPMRYRVRSRRANLAKLEEMFPDKNQGLDKSKADLLNTDNDHELEQ